jgi:hypothetical protein
MTRVQYCTPKWLEETAKIYAARPEFKEKLRKLSVKMCFRVNAEPAWGIDADIIFGAFFEQGDLTRFTFFSEEDARRESEYILAASPQQWKKLLRKQSKFVTDFMLGKIKLEMGSKVGVLGVAPHSGNIVDWLTQVEIQFPDEMTDDERAEYRSNMAAFRQELGV